MKLLTKKDLERLYDMQAYPIVHREDWYNSLPNVNSEPVMWAEHDYYDAMSSGLRQQHIDKSSSTYKTYTVPLYTTPQPDRVKELEASLQGVLNAYAGLCMKEAKLESELENLEKLAEVYRDKAEQLEADKAELLEALRDLSFECFGGIGTTAPSIHTYNRTFKLIAEMESK